MENAIYTWFLGNNMRARKFVSSSYFINLRSNYKSEGMMTLSEHTLVGPPTLGIWKDEVEE